jgi:hypothetical protein
MRGSSSKVRVLSLMYVDLEYQADDYMPIVVVRLFVTGPDVNVHRLMRGSFVLFCYCTSRYKRCMLFWVLQGEFL